MDCHTGPSKNVGGEGGRIYLVANYNYNHRYTL